MVGSEMPRAELRGGRGVVVSREVELIGGHCWFHCSPMHTAFLVAALQAHFIPQLRSMLCHPGRISTVCNKNLGQLLNSVGKSDLV